MPGPAALECPSCAFATPNGRLETLLQAVCPQCGSSWRVQLSADARQARKPSAEDATEGLLRYAALLPVSGDARIPPHGRTPLQPLRGAPELRLKREATLPCGSSVFRGLALAAAVASEQGFAGLVTAGNGEAAAAAALCAAAAGLRSLAFLPVTTTVAEHLAAFLSGAALEPVDGDGAAAVHALEAWRLTLPEAESRGLLDVSAAHHPLRVEGASTLAFELCEQLGWQVPEAVLCPARADLILGLANGFRTLGRAGWTSGPAPKLFALALVNGIAESETPAKVASAIEAEIRSSGGQTFHVSPAESLASMQHAASSEGLLLSLEGAAGLAAWERLRGTRPDAPRGITVVVDPSSPESTSAWTAAELRLRRPFGLPRSLPVGGIITPV